MLFWRRHKNRILADIISDIIRTQVKIMGDLTNLNAAIAANKFAVDAVVAEVKTLQGASVSDQAAIDAATAAVTANTAAVTAVLPPAPAPAPAPAA